MHNALKRQPVVVNPMLTHPEELRLSLSGDWGFRLDPEERGMREAWYRNPHVFLDTVQVPGCWQGQGFGSDAKEKHKEFGIEIEDDCFDTVHTLKMSDIYDLVGERL